MGASARCVHVRNASSRYSSSWRSSPTRTTPRLQCARAILTVSTSACTSESTQLLAFVVSPYVSRPSPCTCALLKPRIIADGGLLAVTGLELTDALTDAVDGRGAGDFRWARCGDDRGRAQPEGCLQPRHRTSTHSLPPYLDPKHDYVRGRSGSRTSYVTPTVPSLFPLQDVNWRAGQGGRG